MRRRAWVIGMTAIALMFVGTIVYAAVVSPDSGGVIHACYDKGGKGAGKIRIVSAGTECKSSENALHWRTMASLNELDLTTCTIGGTTGTTTLEWDADGYARFKCEGATPPECTSGDERSCYSGPAGTAGIGLCSSGTQTCTGGTWGVCQGEVTPSPETCDTFDNDCDGAVDDACTTDICGDGTVSANEECDDGNADPADGCSPTCEVELGWACTGSTCSDVDECSTGADNCGANATCTNEPGSYSCTCDAGFVGDGTSCTPE